jgi:hypothetical protein
VNKVLERQVTYRGFSSKASKNWKEVRTDEVHELVVGFHVMASRRKVSVDQEEKFLTKWRIFDLWKRNSEVELAVAAHQLYAAETGAQEASVDVVGFLHDRT